jgi:outer membrane protein TolC
LASIALTVPSETAAAEPWTLERVLAAARTTHPSARSARASSEAGHSAGGAAFSALSPRLTLEASAVRTDDPAVLFTQHLRQGQFTAEDFALEQLNDPAEESALDAGLVLDVPLWNGGVEITAPAAASQLRRAAAAEEDVAIAATLLRAVETYVEAVSARDALEADSIALAAAAERMRIAVELYRRDLAPEVDTLRATASWGEARVASLDGFRRATVALERLSLFVDEEVRAGDLADIADLDLPTDASTEGLDDGVDTETTLDEIDDLGAAQPGVTGRGELRAAGANVDRLALEARRAGYRLLPSLNSRASVTYYRPWDSGDGARRWGVGLALSLPLWDGTQRHAEWKLASARADAARADREELERDLAAASLDALAAARIARERRRVAGVARAAAEEALRLATERYRAGLLPMGELLLADAEAARARHRQIESEGGLVLSHFRYLHARGELR